MDEATLEFDLPGFRFHPTEEELLEFYLRNMVFGKKLRYDIIGFLNIYHHDPWDLPGLARIGEREWYFYVPRDRKHGSGGRPNRTTEKGFWKATGSDRKILSLKDPKKMIGLKKTLVFYQGRAPRGSKTDWVMNEFRLPDSFPSPKDIVLCKIYRKATSLKVLEQRAAMEEEMNTIHSFPSPPPSLTPPPPPPLTDTLSFSGHPDDFPPLMAVTYKKEGERKEKGMVLPLKGEKREIKDEKEEESMDWSSSTTNALKLPAGRELSELQVPKINMDWTQDLIWAQIRSPWLDNLTPLANILNF